MLSSSIRISYCKKKGTLLTASIEIKVLPVLSIYRFNTLYLHATNCVVDLVVIYIEHVSILNCKLKF